MTRKRISLYFYFKECRRISYPGVGPGFLTELPEISLLAYISNLPRNISTRNLQIRVDSCCYLKLAKTALLEVAIVFHSTHMLVVVGVAGAGLINYINRIHSVVIVVICLRIHVAHIYTKYWIIGLNEWKWVISWLVKTALSLGLRSLKKPILKDIGRNMLFHGEIRLIIGCHSIINVFNINVDCEGLGTHGP
jgi:hypothetical protein